jgi:hypothetical protein
MKYLKMFNEMLDPMGSWNPSQLDNKEDEYDGVPSSYDEDGEIIIEDDVDDFCTKCDCIPCQCTDEEYDEDLRENSNRGTFGYFNTMTKEELLDYQKNFEHDFENPAEHDPEYVAWKTACELKGCFKREPFARTRKESEFPSKY